MFLRSDNILSILAAAQSPLSDNDGGERPMRQQLKETNLDAAGQDSDSNQANRKRTLDDTDGADVPPNKRSRECTPENNSHDSSAEQGLKPTGTPAVDDNSHKVSDPKEHPKPTHTPGNPTGPGIIYLIRGPRQSVYKEIPVELEVNAQTGRYQLSSREPIVLIEKGPPPRSLSKLAGCQNHPPKRGLIEVLESSEASVGYSSDASGEYWSEVSESQYDTDASEDDGFSSEGSGSFSDTDCYTPNLDPESDPSSLQDAEPPIGGNEDNASQTLKKKRSHEQLEDEETNKSHATTDSAPNLTEPTSSDEKDAAEGQPEKKKPRDNSQERKSKTFTASAFGQASAGSPFALKSSTSGASPFGMTAAKSAFGASPFGASGASTGGFGASGFGSPLSGIPGKLSSFASPNSPAGFSGTAGKLSSFASPNAPASFGDSKDKVLGATQSEKEESDNEAGEETNDTFVAEKTDERFHEKTVETGEENESTEFVAKGKLYYFDDKKWKERGVGTFKVNSKSGDDGKFSARMIMRADGAHRVMLNSALWSTMPFGVKDARPTSRDIYLASKEDAKVSTLLLRLGNDKQTGELYDVLETLMKKIK
ncbi:hypothetical protein N7461_008364 [Penicillium sp. DV-2018c]|nr:hypothetical protein N7461_008364 [Penicillium sp. DV-2018c]